MLPYDYLCLNTHLDRLAFWSVFIIVIIVRSINLNKTVIYCLQFILELPYRHFKVISSSDGFLVQSQQSNKHSFETNTVSSVKKFLQKKKTMISYSWSPTRVFSVESHCTIQGTIQNSLEFKKIFLTFITYFSHNRGISEVNFKE